MTLRNYLPQLPRDGQHDALAGDIGDFLPKTADRRELQVLRETRLRLAVQKGRAILEKVALDHRLAATACMAGPQNHNLPKKPSLRLAKEAACPMKIRSCRTYRP